MSGAADHPNIGAVRGALAARGVTAEIVVLPDAVATAAAAAQAVGVDVAQIANSLVFAADGEPVLVMTSGGHRVDTAKVAEVLGVERVERADPEFVRAATGQAIGGVAPVGHPAPIRTLVDRTLADHDVIWAAGGVPRAVFATTYADLVAVTDGTPATVA